MPKSVCKGNDSNAVCTRTDVVARQMRELKVSALESGGTIINISTSALDLNYFSSNKTYACIDLIWKEFHMYPLNVFVQEQFNLIFIFNLFISKTE